MLVSALAIVMMLAILSVLIIVHEFGHFSVARFFGFQTPVFGFGLPFGPHWVLGRKWGTEFRLHACLLGGYVAIPELGDETNATQENYGVPLRPFRKFPIWQRALVAFAGVGFNILFAYLVMVMMLATVGQPTYPTVVHALVPSNPIAARAGIKVNDQVVSLEGKTVDSPEDAVHILSQHKQQSVHVYLIRDGKPLQLEVTTNADGKVGMVLISKGPVRYSKVEENFIGLLTLSANKLYTLTGNMLEALGEMFKGIFSFGRGGATAGGAAVGLQDLHGVLAVVKIGADIAQQDWSQLFLFTILISMDLAIINLVPWPALDGGHLAFMALEAVRGRPMGERAQSEIVKWGFLSLILLMAVIMVNDITALVTGKLDRKRDSQDDARGRAEKQDRKGKNSAYPSPPGENVQPGGASKEGEAKSSATSGDSQASTAEKELTPKP